MRRLLTSIAVAVVTTVVPSLVLAGNQEIAEQIANKLRNSGQMSDYRIGVKYQDGTVWLRGQVATEEQMNTALRLVFQSPGVEGVVNELKVSESEAIQTSHEEPVYERSRSEQADNAPAAMHSSAANPLRVKDSGILSKRPLQNLIKRSGTKKPQQVSSQPVVIRERIIDESDSIQQTAAMESQEMPKQMPAPDHAKPISKMPRGTAKVALMQQGVRGPGDPNGGPMPMYSAAANPAGTAPARYDQPCMPNYSWPSYAAYPNYAAVTYPKQYSPTAWPYIGPFYPYPQVPLGWRKVTLEWDSGWWFLDFKDQPASVWHR